MEKVTYVGNQKSIERFLLGIFTFYTITLVLIGNMNGWPEFYDIIWLCSLCAAWTVSLSKLSSYEFRMCVFAFLMQVSVLLYALNTEKFSEVIPTFMVFVVLLGLSGMAILVVSTIVTLFVIFTFHLASTGTEVLAQLPILVSQLANVLLLQFAVYTWSKRNDEGSKQLLDTIEELKKVQSSKDDFVANVSHEIRTPINTICGMSELLLREPLPNKVKENVISMQMAGRNLIGVISDVLDFSELQSGKIELEEETYNITSTINDIINMAEAKKEEKRIELIIDCDATLPSALQGDEKKLRRVIMNLVDNAIKFTEEGCVSLHIGYRKEVYGINLIVQVKDTGIGISERNLEKIFTSFSQVDASRRRQESGLGLGLAISNALIQKMGGAITMKSKLRKGTTVQIVVPQKIVDETPIAVVNNKQRTKVAVFIDMEQFRLTPIRDEYANMILHMMEQLKVQCHVCRNLLELQRRHSAERFSHIFISLSEYKAEQDYFDEMSKYTRVAVIIDPFDEEEIGSSKIFKLHKPFYILSITDILNNNYIDQKEGNQQIFESFFTQNTHVLAVDDNRMNLMVLEEILKNYKISVTTAISGMEALNKITAENYDFVLMDHMMPEMDGVETLHRIRKMSGAYYSKVPIIVLTANAVAGAREALLEEGFTEFMEKPIERSVLERMLKRTLSPEKIVSREVIREEQNKDNTDDNEWMEIEGINITQGMLYCNGKEGLFNILCVYCDDNDDTGKLAKESFEKADWANYTIAVHGLKSAMFSVGATKVSEMAKKLELAGKEGRIDYIKAHHHELMNEYEALLERLRQSNILKTMTSEEDEINGLPVLEREHLQKALANMEEAMYVLDASIMLEIVDELEAYQYKGKNMKKVLAPVRRKIEMSDLISAYAAVTKWMEETE